MGALNRSSRALTYPRFGPLFLRTSSYAQSWPSRVHVLHRGLLPSHLSFLFRHIIQARRFGLGTSELFGGCVVVAVDSPLSFPFNWTVTVSAISPVPFMAVSMSGVDILSRAGPPVATERSGGLSGGVAAFSCREHGVVRLWRGGGASGSGSQGPESTFVSR